MALQAENCDDAEVVYSFLDTNKIGKTHSIFYIAYASHLESKNKIRTANDIYELGISRYAFLPLESFTHFVSFTYHILFKYHTL